MNQRCGNCRFGEFTGVGRRRIGNCSCPVEIPRPLPYAVKVHLSWRIIRPSDGDGCPTWLSALRKTNSNRRKGLDPITAEAVRLVSSAEGGEMRTQAEIRAAMRQMVACYRQCLAMGDTDAARAACGTWAALAWVIGGDVADFGELLEQLEAVDRAGRQ